MQGCNYIYRKLSFGTSSGERYGCLLFFLTYIQRPYVFNHTSLSSRSTSWSYYTKRKGAESHPEHLSASLTRYRFFSLSTYLTSPLLPARLAGRSAGHPPAPARFPPRYRGQGRAPRAPSAAASAPLTACCGRCTR